MERYHNLVILSEGYMADEKEKFFETAKKTREVLLEQPMYQELLEKINIYTYFVPSEQSGISHIALSPSPSDPIQTSAIKNTPFNVHYLNSYRAYLFFDQTKRYEVIHEAAARAVPFTDTIIVLVNVPQGEQTSGRADANHGIAIVGVRDNYVSSWEKYLLWHEYAHALGGLGDEYSSTLKESFNKTAEKNPDKIRWKSIAPADNLFRLHASNHALALPDELCLMDKGCASVFCSVCKHRLSQVVNEKENQLKPVRSYRLTIDTDNKEVLASWEAVKGATSYEFYSKKLGNHVLNTPEFFVPYDTLSPLEFDTHVSIRAFNDEKSSVFSELNYYFEAYYTLNPSPLAEPHNINVRMIDNKSFALSWESGEEYCR